jgi:hypothetical protein
MSTEFAGGVWDAMSKAPWFPWYPKDCDTDEKVKAMDDAHFGFFVRCLNHSWLNDGLPSDLGELADTMLRKKNYVEKLWPRVGRCFEVGADGRFRNSKQEELRGKYTSVCDSKRKAAGSRWKRKKDADAMHMQSTCNASGAESPMHMQCYPETETETDVFAPSPGKTILFEKQNPEPFDLEDWFERIYACHPRKGHKIPAQQYLGTHPSIMDARWRVKFEDSHAKWCGCEDWQWKGGVKAPYLFEFLRDETYNYEPPKSKDGDSRPAKQSVWQEAV